MREVQASSSGNNKSRGRKYSPGNRVNGITIVSSDDIWELHCSEQSVMYRFLNDCGVHLMLMSHCMSTRLQNISKEKKIKRNHK